MLRVATYNANSIRARLDATVAWLCENAPDILAVQETKVQDADFPVDAFRDAGYHVVFRGEKSYNGVAIISREEPRDVVFGFDDGGPPDEARLIRVRIGEVNIVNTYVPQGRAVDDPLFLYKLEWFDRLKALFDSQYTPETPLLWMGDLNVAPEALDVYDPERLDGSVCFHPEERGAFKSLLGWGFTDVFRKHCGEGGRFTFWDYRSPQSVKRNLGWRLDHILATAPLARLSRGVWIDRDARLKPRPSDHTFLVADFDR